MDFRGLQIQQRWPRRGNGTPHHPLQVGRMVQDGVIPGIGCDCSPSPTLRAWSDRGRLSNTFGDYFIGCGHASRRARCSFSINLSRLHEAVVVADNPPPPAYRYPSPPPTHFTTPATPPSKQQEAAFERDMQRAIELSRVAEEQRQLERTLKTTRAQAKHLRRLRHEQEALNRYVETCLTYTTAAPAPTFPDVVATFWTNSDTHILPNGVIVFDPKTENPGTSKVVIELCDHCGEDLAEHGQACLHD
ncbi:hypothetical protein BT96DRAFT_1002915 [Gymnopus androsaceus JB14]|uniref:Uncharacterized protein n=1 Tax=Gymnopus androsaceus JB14 TaxID=1447944 RepID=A0A6A4GXE4_9AGAR|nr:hypothetical protein BT96DRAFT_1002915 [Gymnopus androsaceus JB14]